jgi:aldose 1-epimerase
LSETVKLAVSDAAGKLEVDLQPHIGGAISRVTWRGIDVLRKTPDSALTTPNVRQLCSYPLVPYSNRIGNGELPLGAPSSMSATTVKLRANFPGESHAIHGIGWQRVWQVASATSARARLTLKHAPDPHWPFAFEAEQVIELTADAFNVTLRATNVDERPMPVGLGFHPFFPIDADTSLQAEWRGMWEMGEDKLPTKLIETPPDADFRVARKVADWKVDNCFVGWTRQATLRYATHQMAITASSACSNIVCFAPRDGRNFIALEPVSNINNGFQLAARGVPNTGVRVLGRGDSMEVSMTITLTAQPSTSSTAKSR